jgi:aryl sulfotransferase
VKLIKQPEIKVYNNFLDSSRWSKIFNYYSNDVIMGSHMKSGTTLLQAIVAYILHKELTKYYNCKINEIPISEISPFLDLKHRSENEVKILLENQKHRRFIKTHLPFNALPYCEDKSVKYIYVVRSFLDIFMSAYDKYKFNAKDEFYNALNSDLKLNDKIIKPKSIKQFFDYMVKNNWGFPGWGFFENVKSWFDRKDKSNVLIVHYDDLINNRRKMIKEISIFLNVKLEDSVISHIDKITSFNYMKKYCLYAVPDIFLWKNANKFYNKGINGRWKNVLTSDQINLYENKSKEVFGEKLSKWINRS